MFAVLMSMATNVSLAHPTSKVEEENLYLYTQVSSEAVTYSINELKKITFNNRGMQMWNTNWPTEYAYSKFRVITVNQKKDETGIKNLTIDSPKDNSVTYYDLQGRQVSSPKQGIYIKRSNNGITRKVIIK